MSASASSQDVSGLDVPSPVVTLAELAAADSGAVVARLPCTVVSASGADAASFLHGQLANDVAGLGVGAANVSLGLNHKGHAVSQGSVLRLGADEFLLAIDDGADWLLESLNSHIIFDQVALEPRASTALLTLQGSAAANFLPLAPEEGAFARLEMAGAELLAVRRRRSGVGGFDLLLGADAVPEVLRALTAAGVVEVDPVVITALRVRGKVPTAGGEGGDGVLPQEALLDDALSYRKGCYLGQEIMARIEARGNLRRSLQRVRLEGRPDGRQIRHGGRVVGLLGSAVSIEDETGAAPLVEALAVLRSDLAEDADLDVGGASALVMT